MDIEAIDSKLDRLAAAYLDEGAFTPSDFRDRKQKLINEKRELLNKLDALREAGVVRFEPLKRFVTGSAELKYVAERAEPAELRTKLGRIGSNLTLRDRDLNWEPRGAWQLVVAKGSLAQHNTAPLHSGAVLCGESRLSPSEWSLPGSNR
ncbi:MAG: hypothetical protein SGJ11_13715 [Phycisphaerae bacterium]|nr:hypothetical protein [Phycisphaerae bacterium]